MNDFDYSLYYSRFHDDSEAHAEQMADCMAGILRPSAPSDRTAPVLDVGCGYGFALRALRRLGFTRLTGLEISPQQAERCRKAGFTVEVCENSIDWISDHPATFDYIMLLDVIEHVPVRDQIELLRAIHRSLRPGGRLLVTTPNANSILASRWRYNDYTHHASFTEHSLDFILRNGGFRTIQIDAEKGLGRFPRRIWRRSAWPVMRRWIVRWCWLQVFKAEIPGERLERISFELNLAAVATKE